MYALISELSDPAAVQVMRLWRQLNQNCGLEGIFSYPNPHFTWFFCGDFGSGTLQADPESDGT